jgi:hypothetical protein
MEEIVFFNQSFRLIALPRKGEIVRRQTSSISSRKFRANRVAILFDYCEIGAGPLTVPEVQHGPHVSTGVQVEYDCTTGTTGCVVVAGPLQNRLQNHPLQPALLIKTVKIAKIIILFIFVLPSNCIFPAKLSPKNSTLETVMCKRNIDDFSNSAC